MYIPSPSETHFEPPPSGTHAAVCYRFIDLGTQRSEYKGTPKIQRKVLITWELPNELMDDGRPFSISQTYTWSMSEKANLRHDLESWRGRKFKEEDFKGPARFDIKNIIGVPALLTVVHDVKEDGTTFANVRGVTALPKGMEKPQAVNTPIYFSLEKDRFNRELFETLSEKLKEKIKGSPEYYELMNGKAKQTERAPSPDDYGAILDDEIPF